MSVDSAITEAVRAAVTPLLEHVERLQAQIVKLATPVPVKAYKVAQAGRALGVSGRTVEKMIAAGELRTVTLPTMSHKMVPATEVDRLLADDRWDDMKAVG